VRDQLTPTQFFDEPVVTYAGMSADGA